MNGMSANTNPPQTVFVVGDEAPLRDAIAMLLGEAGVACQTFAGAREFLDAFAAWSAQGSGCLVLDPCLPDMSGLELQDMLVADGVRLPIIFITGHGDVAMAVRAMKGGAVDFLRKPFDHEELLARINEALAADAKRYRAERKHDGFRAREATLTPRELQVFERIALGYANKAIAIDFGISERTVEIHRGRVMKKMQARNLAVLVRMKIFIDLPKP